MGGVLVKKALEDGGLAGAAGAGDDDGAGALVGECCCGGVKLDVLLWL